MKHFVFAVLLAAFVLSLASCAPVQMTEAYSPGGVQLSIFQDGTGGDTPLVSPSAASNVSVYNYNGTKNVTVTIYGHNSSAAIVEVISQVTNATKTTLNNTFTGVDCVIVNQSQQGGVLVTSYGTGATIASFNASQSKAFNPVSYNGSNYVCPSQNSNGINSSAFAVGQYSEYVLFVSCDTPQTNNLTMRYWSSPDGSLWVPGVVTLSSCNSSANPTAFTLTDKGVGFLKFNVNQSDVRVNRVSAKLVAK